MFGGSKPSILFAITSDPRTSGRPAEAVRIAAGVGTWQQAEVVLYLRGPAALALTEFSDELIDGDHFARYLPIVRESAKPIYVEKGAPERLQLAPGEILFEEITDAQLAELAASVRYVARF